MRFLLSHLASGLLALALGGQALAADTFTERHEGAKPAVAGLNAKLDLGWVWTDGVSAAVPGRLVAARTNAFAAQGAVSLPVGDAFGLQIDGGFSTGRTKTPAGSVTATSAGAGSHLFWRNPDMGLLGFYGHYIRSEAGIVSSSSWRYGAEAEAYLGRFSLEGFLGADSSSIKAPAIPAIRRTTLAATARLAFYPTDNLRLDAGVEHAFKRTNWTGGAEWMMDTGRAIAPALYARAGFDGDATTVGAGLKLYFGSSPKSLMARHREDDPQVNLLGHIGALENAGRTTDVISKMFPGAGNGGLGVVVIK